MLRTARLSRLIPKSINLKITAKMASSPKKTKVADSSNLVWIDCEMTGLNHDTDKLLEIAVIVTDKDLNILGEGPNLVIHQPEEVTKSRHVLRKFHFTNIESERKRDRQPTKDAQ